jgi:protein tyrosine phosphatase (PTP) superfamily phosphohydrolase (DUF442 family)
VSRHIRFALIAAILSVAGAAIKAQASEVTLRAPNVVPISATLVTSGQPTADALAKLAGQGFSAVIYLAPPTVADAVPGEAEIVRKQGLEFFNIPIPFGKPTDSDFESFVQLMKRLSGKKVLVHCQVNMRASTFVFLYRVIVNKENPEQAYEAVAKVWSPDGPWKALLTTQLHAAGVSFTPY